MQLIKQLIFLTIIIAFVSCRNNERVKMSRDNERMFKKEIVKSILKKYFTDLNIKDTVLINNNFIQGLDTLQINHHTIDLVYQDKKYITNNYLKIKEITFKKWHYDLDFQNKKFSGFIKNSEIEPLKIGRYENDYIYLMPLKNNLDIIKRVLYDSELNFWIRSDQKETIQILDKDNYLKRDSFLINNYLLVDQNNTDDIKTILITIMTKDHLIIKIQNNIQNLDATFNFIKTKNGYLLQDKKIFVN